MRDLVRAAGIGGEDQGEFPVPPRLPPLTHPRRSQPGNVFDALCVRLVKHSTGGFAILEGDRAGENAPVDFRQHDMHGEIGRGQRARGLAPRLLGASRHRGLNDGAVRAIERGARILAARGKRCRVDDHVRRVPAELLAQPLRRAGRFQAGDVVSVEAHTQRIRHSPQPSPHGRGGRSRPLRTARPLPWGEGRVRGVTPVYRTERRPGAHRLANRKER